MMNILLVGLGGFVGAVTRYKVGGMVLHHSADWKFPFSTFLVNVSGCLIAGILMGLAETREFFTPQTRLFLFTGVLGGFTTFSAFGVETVQLLQRQEFTTAVVYVTASVVVGISVLWLGVKLV